MWKTSRSEPPDQAVRRNNLKCQKGQSLVEFALVLPLLALVIFVIVDFSILFHVYQSLEHGISLACRYGVTGSQEEDPNNAGTTLSREDSTRLIMRRNNSFVTLDDSDFKFEHLNGSSWATGIGGASEISRVTVTCTWKPICPLVAVLLDHGQLRLRVSGTMKNESYPSS